MSATRCANAICPNSTNSRACRNWLCWASPRRITIEVCPTSNLQTIPELGTLKDHPIQQMINNGLSVSVSTDNRLVSHTTVCRELQLCIDHLTLTDTQFRDLVLAGFKRSFFPGSYAEKRAYVRRAINLYDTLAKQHLS